VRGTLVIKELNIRLGGGGCRPISVNLLAEAIRPNALAPEVLDVIFGIETLA